MKTCSECDKPLFEEEYAPEESGLCDGCYILLEEDDSDEYDSETRHLV